MEIVHEPLGGAESTPPSDFTRGDQIYAYMVWMCSYACPLLNFIISTIFDEFDYHGNPRPIATMAKLTKIDILTIKRYSIGSILLLLMETVA